MSRLNHRTRSRRKRRWTHRVTHYPASTTLEEKKTPLWLSQYADENGVITHPGVNAMLDEAIHGEDPHGS